LLFFIWIAYGIYITISQLKPRDKEKLQMYRRLSFLLGVSIATSVFIVIAELITQATDDSDKQFRSSWLWQGYWELVYCACILFVAWVWRPNEDNKRFAYIDTQEDEPTPHKSSSFPGQDDPIPLDEIEPKGEAQPSESSDNSDSDSESSGFDSEPEDRKIPTREGKVNIDESESTSSSDDD